MNQRRIRVLIIFLLALSFISCTSQKTDKNTSLISDGEYNVKLNIGSFETIGAIRIEKDRIQLEYTDTESPLYGLKETFQPDRYLSDYRSILWESAEFPPATHVIFKAIEELKTSSEIKTVEFEGETATQVSKTNEQGTYHIYINKNTKKPTKLNAVWNGIELSLRFLYQ